MASPLEISLHELNLALNIFYQQLFKQFEFSKVGLLKTPTKVIEQFYIHEPCFPLTQITKLLSLVILF